MDWIWDLIKYRLLIKHEYSLFNSGVTYGKFVLLISISLCICWNNHYAGLDIEQVKVFHR